MLEPSTQLVNMAELPTRPAFPQKHAVPGRRADAWRRVGDRGRADHLSPGAGRRRSRSAGPTPGCRSWRRSRGCGCAGGPAQELLARKREFPLAAALRPARLASAAAGDRAHPACPAGAGRVRHEAAQRCWSPRRSPGEGKTLRRRWRLARFAARLRAARAGDRSRPAPARSWPAALGGPPSPGLRRLSAERRARHRAARRRFPGVDVLLAGEPRRSQHGTALRPAFPGAAGLGQALRPRADRQRAVATC